MSTYYTWILQIIADIAMRLPVIHSRRSSSTAINADPERWSY